MHGLRTTAGRIITAQRNKRAERTHLRECNKTKSSYPRQLTTTDGFIDRKLRNKCPAAQVHVSLCIARSMCHSRIPLIQDVYYH